MKEETDSFKAGERAQRIPRDQDAEKFAFSDKDIQEAADKAVSRAQHTSGPWEHYQEGHNAAGWPCFVILGPDTAVAKIYTGVEEDYPGQAEANARLIAAAPELLEACKELVQQLKNYRLQIGDRVRVSNDTTNGCSYALKIGNEVINRAEGRE